jgi:hypothetical protein
MTDVLLLPESLNTKDKPLARVIPIRFIADKKIKTEIKVVKEKEKKEPILFYTRPIFKANKYEFY